MHKHKVVAAAEHSGIVAVEDSDGRCHVGKALARVPPPDAELLGAPPAAGVLQLAVAGADIPCPVALVLLDCDREAVARLVATK